MFQQPDLTEVFLFLCHAVFSCTFSSYVLPLGLGVVLRAILFKSITVERLEHLGISAASCNQLAVSLIAESNILARKATPVWEIK